MGKSQWVFVDMMTSIMLPLLQCTSPSPQIFCIDDYTLSWMLLWFQSSVMKRSSGGGWTNPSGTNHSKQQRGTCWCQGDKKTIASPCMTSVLKFDVATSNAIQTSGLYIVLFIRKPWGRWWYLQLKLLGYLRGLNSICGMSITTYFIISKISKKCLQSIRESHNRISFSFLGVSISQGCCE